MVKRTPQPLIQKSTMSPVVGKHPTVGSAPAPGAGAGPSYFLAGKHGLAAHTPQYSLRLIHGGYATSEPFAWVRPMAGMLAERRPLNQAAP